MATITYDVKDLGTVDDQHVVDQLAQMGYNPQGPSADGRTITLVDAQGPYTLSIPDALSKLGYEVQGMTVVPEAASFDTVSAALRAGVAKLPSDSMRQQYLEQSLINKGIPDPKVVGQGRDWYYYDPQGGGYKALTNTPGWDAYDGMEAAVELPRVVGSALGGFGGAALGGAGAIPGAMAGGGIADVATRYAISQISPEFRQVAEQNMGTMAKDVGVNMAIDGATMGVAKAAPAAIGAVFPAWRQGVSNVMNKGIVSPTVKAAGQAVEATGRGVAGAARTLQTPFGRSVAGMGIPGVAEAEIAGELLNLPAAALRNSPNLMQRLGSTRMAEEYFPAAAQALRRGGQNLRRATTAVDPGSATERIARMMRVPGSEEAIARGATAPAVARVLGERGVRRLGQGLHSLGLRETPFNPGTVKAAGQFAERLGRGAENVGRFGQGLATTARGVTGAALGGIQGAGNMARYAGSAIKKAGTLGSPLETRAAMQQGGDWLKDEAMERLERLQRARLRASMDQTLASN